MENPQLRDQQVVDLCGRKEMYFQNDRIAIFFEITEFYLSHRQLNLKTILKIICNMDQ